MRLRQAFKITNATKITDLCYLNDDQMPISAPLVAIGVRKGYKYSFRQFKKAFRLVERYYKHFYECKRNSKNNL